MDPKLSADIERIAKALEAIAEHLDSLKSHGIIVWGGEESKEN